MKIIDGLKGKATNISRRKLATAFVVAITVLLVVVAVSGIFSIQNVDTIVIKGESIYSDEEIISASGVNYGEPLFSVNTKEVETKIQSDKPYLREVKVTRRFFSRLVIEVVCDTPKYFVSLSSSSDGVYLLSDEMRVIDYVSSAEAKETGAVYLELPEIDSCTINHTVKLVNPEKNGYVDELISYFESQDYADKISAIGLKSQFDGIYIEFSGKCRIILGDSRNIADKMKNAEKTINDEIERQGIDRIKDQLATGGCLEVYISEDSGKSYARIVYDD